MVFKILNEQTFLLGSSSSNTVTNDPLKRFKLHLNGNFSINNNYEYVGH